MNVNKIEFDILLRAINKPSSLDRLLAKKKKKKKR